MQRADGPERVAARQPERAERIGIGERLQHERAQAGAQPQIADRIVAGAALLLDDAAIVLGQAADLAQAEPHRVGGVDIVPHRGMAGVRARFVAGRFQRAIPVRCIDIDVAHLDAMLLRVAHDLRRRVEAHRLAVEQRRREHIRVMAFQPARGVDQIGEARGMAFRKAVFAEALDLLEAALGEIALVALRHHALDHLALERADGADPPERRHRAAQPVGLRRPEAGRHDRDPHRLFLEQRHAERLAEHLFKLVGWPGRRGRRIGDEMRRLAPLQIGMHHLALDRAGPHDRDLDHEIVEFLRLQPRQHRHLRAAFDLEHADGVGALDHPVGRARPRPASRDRAPRRNARAGN